MYKFSIGMRKFEISPKNSDLLSDLHLLRLREILSQLKIFKNENYKKHNLAYIIEFR